MITEKLYKNSKAISVISALMFVAVAFVGVTFASNGYDITEQLVTNEASIVSMVVYLLIGIVVATHLLPTIFNNTAVLETDSAGDLDTNEESLIGTWNILIIVGIMLAIIGVAM